MADASGRGRFITLEGVDGAGKSTHIPWIARQLRAAGHAVIVTREPGGTPLAEKLRSLILADSMDPLTETLLLFAARADHVQHIIRPALERGDWVLCDRFGDATVAYQHGGKGVPIELIERLGEAAHAGLAPDRTLVFDCSYELSRRRLAGTGRTLDRFEREDRGFFDRVRAVYANLAEREPSRIRRIDGAGSLEQIKGELERHLLLP